MQKEDLGVIKELLNLLKDKNQITSRPIDRRLQTLQTLLGSGILNDLDSDTMHTILDAIMR